MGTVYSTKTVPKQVSVQRWLVVARLRCRDLRWLHTLASPLAEASAKHLRACCVLFAISSDSLLRLTGIAASTLQPGQTLHSRTG